MLDEDIIDETITITCINCTSEFVITMPEPGQEIATHCPNCPDLEKL